MSFILASLDVSLRSRLFLFDTLPPYKQNGKKRTTIVHAREAKLRRRTMKCNKKIKRMKQ